MQDLMQDVKAGKKKLESLKAKAHEIDMKRVKGEAALEHLRAQEHEVMETCKKLGYQSAEDLREALATKMAQLTTILEKLEQLTNGQQTSLDETFALTNSEDDETFEFEMESTLDDDFEI